MNVVSDLGVCLSQGFICVNKSLELTFFSLNPTKRSIFIVKFSITLRIERYSCSLTETGVREYWINDNY